LVDKQVLKLVKLCEHWANHNESHKENFQKWSEIAKEMGLYSVADNLNKAIEMMDKCNDYLIAAKTHIDI